MQKYVARYFAYASWEFRRTFGVYQRLITRRVQVANKGEVMADLKCIDG